MKGKSLQWPGSQSWLLTQIHKFSSPILTSVLGLLIYTWESACHFVYTYTYLRTPTYTYWDFEWHWIKSVDDVRENWPCSTILRVLYNFYNIKEDFGFLTAKTTFSPGMNVEYYQMSFWHLTWLYNFCSLFLIYDYIWIGFSNTDTSESYCNRPYLDVFITLLITFWICFASISLRMFLNEFYL